MFRRLARTILVVASLALLALCLWPQIFGLSRTNPFAFFVASRGASTVVALISIVVLSLLGILGRRVRRVLRPVLTWFVVFAIASGLLLYQAGWKDTAAAQAPGQIVIFSWNTMGGKAGAESIAAAAMDAHADVVSLPETTAEVGSQVASLMSKSGKAMTTLTTKFDDVYKAHSTVVLISQALGGYQLDTSVGDTGTSPSLVALPTDPGAPIIVAAHAMAPEAGKLEQWRTDLTWLAARCKQPNVIMAGDFNASIDNVSGLGPAPMGNCGDVALKLGGASIGTWPSSMPTLLGTQIDHVFYSAEWKPVGFRVITSLPSAVSDHRPVVATLAPVTK
jgi:endonuclease/exonuclease/phosphatase (EEP) superfamily protein YafD